MIWLSATHVYRTEANQVRILVGCNHLCAIELQERADRQKCACNAERAMRGVGEREREERKQVRWRSSEKKTHNKAYMHT